MLLPEIVVLVIAVWIYVGGVFTQGSRLWSFVAAGGLAVAASHLWRMADRAPGSPLWEPFAVDPFSYSLRWCVLGVGLLFIAMLSHDAARGDSGETYGSLLVLIAGLMLVVAANDLIVLFLGLELVSIPTYVLLYLGRRDRAGNEAVLKYFFLSILSSAVMLYGFSFLYGLTGSLNLAEIHAALGKSVGQLPLAGGDAALAGAAGLGKLAALLIFAALAFKIAAAPMHFYAPDVYEGTSTINAGLLAVAPKIAGIVVLVRLFVATWTGLGGVDAFGWALLLGAALLTMTLGNVLALWQTNVRRMLAYSSIAHSGYMLIGLATALANRGQNGLGARDEGAGATLFYLAMYVVATIGTFAALAYLRRQDAEIETLDDLAGVSRSHPTVAVSLAVFMFSLAGIPPLAGFFGKLSLLFGSIDVYLRGAGEEPGTALASAGPWFLALSIVAAVNAAIAAAYYLRVVAALYFREPRGELRPSGGPGALGVTWLCAVLVVVGGLRSGPLLAQANEAAQAAQHAYDSSTPPAKVTVLASDRRR